MTDREIYKFWLSKVRGARYLHPDRWIQLKPLIKKHKLTSVLEFGSGVSTLLFAHNGLSVVSYETDKDYMELVRSLCEPKVDFRLWDNVSANISGSFDLALVDGILPRNTQLELSLQHAVIIAIDDYELTTYHRIDDRTSKMSIFLKD